MTTLSTTTLRRAGRGLKLTGLGLVVVAVVAASGAAIVHQGAARPFSVKVSPTGQAIPEGTSATFRISIARGSYRGRVAVSVSGLPPFASSRINYQGQNQANGVLKVTTSYLYTPVRRYPLRLKASGGRFATTVAVNLNVQAPRLVPFGISGSLTGLQPGVPQALDLSLRNPYQPGLVVRSVAVAIQNISAPRATPSLPCTAADFSVQQYSGGYPLVLSGSSTVTLSGLGVAPAARPTVTLLARPLDQDGCQGATVSLAYTGSAEIL